MIEHITYPAITVYGAQLQTSLAQLPTAIGNQPQIILAAAVHEGLVVTGPQHSVYLGVDGTPDKLFSLWLGWEVSPDAGLPVQYHLFTFPASAAVSYELVGDYSQLSSAYAQIYAFIQAEGLIPTGYIHEVYVHQDRQNPAANRTQLVVAVQG